MVITHSVKNLGIVGNVVLPQIVHSHLESLWGKRAALASSTSKAMANGRNAPVRWMDRDLLLQLLQSLGKNVGTGIHGLADGLNCMDALSDAIGIFPAGQVRGSIVQVRAGAVELPTREIGKCLFYSRMRSF